MVGIGRGGGGVCGWGSGGRDKLINLLKPFSKPKKYLGELQIIPKEYFEIF